MPKGKESFGLAIGSLWGKHLGATGRLPAGVLGAVPPEQPGSVGRGVPSHMHWVEDMAHVGDYSC